MTEAINRGLYGFSLVNMAFIQAMYKKGTGNDKQGKDTEITKNDLILNLTPENRL